MEPKIGYLARDIEYALFRLGYTGKSEASIRRYARKNGLAVQRDSGFQKTYLIPISNLEKLLEGLEIPIRTKDLLEELY